MRTGNFTLSAVCTTGFPHELGMFVLPFRVMAPQATQRTSLTEYRRTYATAIMYSEFFYVEDNTRHVSSARIRDVQ